MAPNCLLPGNNSVHEGGQGGTNGPSSYTPRENSNLNILRCSLGDPRKTNEKKRRFNSPVGIKFTLNKFLYNMPMTLNINVNWFHGVSHMHIFPDGMQVQKEYTSALVDYLL